MATTLAERMNILQGSASAAVMARVTEMKRQGADIIGLNVGEPDFATPDHIKAAAEKAIEDNYTKYTPAAGIMELREAIADKLKNENNIEYSAGEIAVSSGAKQALFSALMAIVSPGDEVIIPTPCYVSYPEMVRFAGGTPVYALLDQEKYSLDVKEIEKAVTPRTKAVIICSPNNPTGTVFDEKSLRALAELAVKYDFFVIADEVYEKLVYGDAKHYSIGSVSPEMRERTITVNSFSKTYAMTGWRIGYAAAREDVIKSIVKIMSQVTSAVNSVSQKAAVEALRGPQDNVAVMVAEFEKRMKYTVERLNAMPGITCPEIQGAFYTFFDVTPYIGKEVDGRVLENDSDVCRYLLDEGKIALMPGSDYMQKNRLRMSYATSMENIKEAMDRMEKALSRILDSGKCEK